MEDAAIAGSTLAERKWGGFPNSRSFFSHGLEFLDQKYTDAVHATYCISKNSMCGGRRLEVIHWFHALFFCDEESRLNPHFFRENDFQLT